MENTLQTSKELVENIVKGVHARPLLALAASNLATGSHFQSCAHLVSDASIYLSSYYIHI